MLGVTLLFVGIVLINNGACALMGVDGKSTAALNVLVGVLLAVLNLLHLVRGDYYSCGTGLLFAFTYLFVAANNLFGLQPKPYGVYSLFVAVNTVPCAAIAAMGGDRRMAVIWIAWGILWFTGFLEGALGKNLGKFSPSLAIAEGVATAWVPGFMMLAGWW